MFVAFLRGMNLGKRRVKNEELCEVFEGLGFGDVSAFLASGNVLFSTNAKSTTKLEPQIEAALKQRFDYEVKTFVRSAKEVKAIAERTPFDAKQLAASNGKVQVAMLAQTPTAKSRKTVSSHHTPDDLLHLDDRELYWLPKGGLSESEIDHKALADALGTMTIRTQRTLIRLAAKLA